MLGRRSLARLERQQLCDAALAEGPDAPTLCGDWDVRALLAHLLVRERSPLGAAGIQVAPLAPLTDRAMDKASARDFPDLVAAVRNARTPLALPLVDDVVNTLEFFVHHEDIRRARAGWEPRTLPRAEESALWTAIKVGGRGLARPAGVPVTIRRADGGATATLRGGADPVVVTGLPSEIVLFLFGRRETRGLTLTGPETAIAALSSADLGI
ncbi:MAG: TIGR03085 family metal-binding protein [Nocardioides sp.]